MRKLVGTVFFILLRWTAAIDYATIPIEIKPLDTPPLEDLATVLTTGLQSNFEQVSVEVVDCPDLTQRPFTLARPGLNGSPKLLQVGAISYLVPIAKTDKIYDLEEIASIIGLDSTFIIGAGGVSYSYAGVNREGVFNLNIARNGTLDVQSRVAFLNPHNQNVPLQGRMPRNETRASFVANLFVSEGQPGKVLQVYAKKRTGELDFLTNIRQSLVEGYPDQVVGLGGTFLVKEGVVVQHVLQNFSQVSVEDAVNENYVNFFNMSAPLIAVGYAINNDYDLDITLQHTHSFSHHGQAGHYRYDSTPETIEYLGYFNVAEEFYRVDRSNEEDTIEL